MPEDDIRQLPPDFKKPFDWELLLIRLIIGGLIVGLLIWAVLAAKQRQNSTTKALTPSQKIAKVVSKADKGEFLLLDDSQSGSGSSNAAATYQRQLISALPGENCIGDSDVHWYAPYVGASLNFILGKSTHPAGFIGWQLMGFTGNWCIRYYNSNDVTSDAAPSTGTSTNHGCQSLDNPGAGACRGIPQYTDGNWDFYTRDIKAGLGPRNNSSLGEACNGLPQDIQKANCSLAMENDPEADKWQQTYRDLYFGLQNQSWGIVPPSPAQHVYDVSVQVRDISALGGAPTAPPDQRLANWIATQARNLNLALDIQRTNAPTLLNFLRTYVGVSGSTVSQALKNAKQNRATLQKLEALTGETDASLDQKIQDMENGEDQQDPNAAVDSSGIPYRWSPVDPKNNPLKSYALREYIPCDQVPKDIKAQAQGGKAVGGPSVPKYFDDPNQQKDFEKAYTQLWNFYVGGCQRDREPSAADTGWKNREDTGGYTFVTLDPPGYTNCRVRDTSCGRLFILRLSSPKVQRNFDCRGTGNCQVQTITYTTQSCPLGEGVTGLAPICQNDTPPVSLDNLSELILQSLGVSNNAGNDPDVKKELQNEAAFMQSWNDDWKCGLGIIDSLQVFPTDSVNRTAPDPNPAYCQGFNSNQSNN